MEESIVIRRLASVGAVLEERLTGLITAGSGLGLGLLVPPPPLARVPLTEPTLPLVEARIL